jgi:AbrB family looped-hinge helix DNA binding protein
MEIVKVQQNSSNTSVSIPRDIREALSIKKGDKMLMTVTKDNKILLEKIKDEV